MHKKAKCLGSVLVEHQIPHTKDTDKKEESEDDEFVLLNVLYILRMTVSMIR